MLVSGRSITILVSRVQGANVLVLRMPRQAPRSRHRKSSITSITRHAILRVAALIPTCGKLPAASNEASYVRSAEVSSLAFSSISTPASALETGQPFLAASAISRNSPSSIAGIAASVSKVMRVIAS